MNNPKVYFIRHKDENANDKIEKLKKIEKIAIFFEDEPCSTVISNCNYTGSEIEYKANYFNNKSKLTKYKSALRYIWELGKNGGLVVAEFGDDSHCLVGRVDPGTPIVSVANLYNITLQLKDIKILNYVDCPVLLAVRPIYGTICCPQSQFFKKIIPEIYNNNLSNIKSERCLLHDKLLEQLCLEYLRKVGVKVGNGTEKLDYCTLRVGKSLATVDIVGVSETGKKYLLK